ncbi:hypothetical protein LY78DRAFT_263776 [Colletotrichum sublineola]|nr:hypothetical protein LY78DRAFT_263776 [Colletotrichum sublineola]
MFVSTPSTRIAPSQTLFLLILPLGIDCESSGSLVTIIKLVRSEGTSSRVGLIHHPPASQQPPLLSVLALYVFLSSFARWTEPLPFISSAVMTTQLHTPLSYAPALRSPWQPRLYLGHTPPPPPP